nr:uncharacterized protein LOC128698872 [Cherax quadricarinatus]XP_053647255.1 uncharacterized protein LOC128698872 [Cherax quadricarinatus]XP_053647256.1 uncharacterized protein LOC128698872 [Cherax quadricarinatus]XP_053647257.1 uncharacterized protein LOC128698872 [Cherax quadricarinatus]
MQLIRKSQRWASLCRRGASTPTCCVWAWVVVMVALGGVVTGGESQEVTLEDTVRSHTETLINMGRYLRQTDKFWKWYQQNHRRLDELMAEVPRIKILGEEEGAPSLESKILELDKKLKALQERYDTKLREREVEVLELREALEEQKVDNRRLLQDLTNRLDAEETSSDRLFSDLTRTKQTLSQSKIEVAALREKVGETRVADVLMFVKNLAIQANRTVESLHAEVRQLRDDQVQGRVQA